MNKKLTFVWSLVLILLIGLIYFASVEETENLFASKKSAVDWTFTNSNKLSDDKSELRSFAPGVVSQIQKPISLNRGSQYRIEFKVEAKNGVDSDLPLLCDVVGKNFDLAEYDFYIEKDQITFESNLIKFDFIAKENMPDEVFLRVYSLSSKAIEISNFKVIKKDHTAIKLIFLLFVFIGLFLIFENRRIFIVWFQRLGDYYSRVLYPRIFTWVDSSSLTFFMSIWFLAFCLNYFFIYKTLGPSIFPDENEYFFLARGFHNFEIAIKSALYNPLYPGLISFFFNLEPITNVYQGILFFNALAFSSIIIPFFLFSKQFFNLKLSLYLSFLLFFSPWVGLTRFIWAEPIYYPLGAWSFFLFYRFLEDRTTKTALIIGTILGLMYLAKQLALTMVMAFGLSLCLEYLVLFILTYQKEKKKNLGKDTIHLVARIKSTINLLPIENRNLVNGLTFIIPFIFIFIIWTKLRMVWFPGNLTGYDTDLKLTIFGILNGFTKLSFWKSFLDLIAYYCVASFFVFTGSFLFSFLNLNKLKRSDLIFSFLIVLLISVQMLLYISSFLDLGTVKGVVYPDGVFPYSRYLCTTVPFIIIFGLRQIKTFEYTKINLAQLLVIGIVMALIVFYFSPLKSAFVVTVAKSPDIEYLNYFFFRDVAPIWKFPRSYSSGQALVYAGFFFVSFILFFLNQSLLEYKLVAKKWFRIIQCFFALGLAVFVITISILALNAGTSYSGFVSNYHASVRFLAEAGADPKNIYFEPEVLEYDKIIPAEFEYVDYFIRNSGIEKEQFEAFIAYLPYSEAHFLTSIFGNKKNKNIYQLFRNFDSFNKEERDLLYSIFKNNKFNFRLINSALHVQLVRFQGSFGYSYEDFDQIMSKYFEVVSNGKYKFKYSKDQVDLKELKVLYNYFLLDLDRAEIYAAMSRFWIDESWIFSTKFASISPDSSKVNGLVSTQDGIMKVTNSDGKFNKIDTRFLITKIKFAAEPVFKISDIYIYEIK